MKGEIEGLALKKLKRQYEPADIHQEMVIQPGPWSYARRSPALDRALSRFIARWAPEHGRDDFAILSSDAQVDHAQLIKVINRQTSN